MSTHLRIGMGQPYGIYITVPSSADFDPTTVTGATFKVTKPVSGTVVSWPGTVPEQSSASAKALYVLNANGLDLDEAGTWRAWVQWTVAGETPGPRSEVISFPVIAADQV